jgi:hypothetical protein
MFLLHFLYKLSLASEHPYERFFRRWKRVWSLN